MLNQLAKPQWQSFFARLSPLLRAQVVEVEVNGLGLGARISADWVRLAELSYGAQNDLRQDGAQLQSIEIVDSEGKRNSLIFKEPLRLAAPPVAAK
jgi:hypothetical protein